MSIDKVIEYAKKNIPFYMNKKFNSIEQFPLITKYMIREDYESFISNEIGSEKNKLVEMLETKTLSTKGWYNDFGVIRDVYVEETSGTTGVPFLCAKTEKERTILGVYLWKERMLRDPEVSKDNYFQFSHIGRNMINPNAYNYQIDHLVQLYSNIKDKKMRWIHGTPNALINHIKVLKENEIKLDLPDLKFIECTGSYLSTEAKKTIEEFFEVKVLDLYGSIETWPIALTCNNDNMHIMEKNVYFELIDSEGNVINETGKVGRIVVTTLRNRIFPLIRYTMGDYAMYLESTQCSCKCKGRMIKLLEGRENNIIKGLPSMKFGNKEFARIVATVKLRFPKLDLRYIKVIQNGLGDFEIWINEFDNADAFIDMLHSIMEQEFDKRLTVTVIKLNAEQIEARKYDKPNIFICKC